MTDSDGFPPLKLTSEQQIAYKKSAQQLLDATLQHYQVHTFHHRREMNRKRWKRVKTREYLTVYKERDPQPQSPAVAFDSTTTATPSKDTDMAALGDDWHDPKLLVATGAIVGSLDDVMYGVVTPDAASMLLKASITQNRLVAGAVLQQLEGPTAHEPFRFLGVKWFVVGAPAALERVIRPRDVLFVEATGIQKLPNGERVGFQLMQSVALAGFGARTLDGHAVTRGRLSSCAVFKQLANGTVDVFVRGHVEAFGRVFDAVALQCAASGFVSAWNAVGCAQYKKLMWCVAHRRRRSSTGSTDTSHPHRSCAVCMRRFHKFSSVGCCILCKQWLCARCRVVATLRDVRPDDQSINTNDAIVCVRCVAHVDALSAFDVAQHEVLAGRFAAPSQQSPVLTRWSFRSRSDSQSHHNSSAAQPPTLADDVAVIGDASGRNRIQSASSHSERVQLFDPTKLYSSATSRTHSWDSEPAASPERACSIAHRDDHDDKHSGYDDEQQLLAVRVADAQPSSSHWQQQEQQQQFDVDESTRSPPLRSPVSQPSGALSPQQQLYKQMLDLQTMTEQIYQLTMQTTDAHLPVQRLGVTTTTTTRQ